LGRGGSSASSGAGAASDAEYFIVEFVRAGGQTRLPVSSQGKGSKKGFRAILFGETAPAAAFWEDWRRMLPPGCPIDSLGEVDLGNVVARVQRDRTAAAAVKKGGNKPPVKSGLTTTTVVKSGLTAPTSTALVDGKPQPVAPFAVDRPGIFRGRNATATMSGRVRRRIVAEDVTLNLGPGAPTPPVPAGCGKAWGGVVRDPKVDWIASWRDPVTGVVKYARLAPGSASEQAAALDKYELARKMRSPAVAAAFERRVRAALVSTDRRRRQLGACLWLIDRLALRVGSGSAAAATAAGAHGAATLLVRHVEHLGHGGGGIRLSFPGKDGVLYERTVPASDLDPREVAAALAEAAKGKGPAEALFDAVDSSGVARAIDEVLSGATAKVLRTCHASAAFESTLLELEGPRAAATRRTQGQPPPSKASSTKAKLALLLASTRAAVMLNHRKATKDALGGGDLAELESKVDALVAEAKRGATPPGDLARRLRDEVVKPAGLSLATARASYIDPRVVFAFGKRTGLTPAAFGGAAYVRKFAWAEATPGSFLLGEGKPLP